MRTRPRLPPTLSQQSRMANTTTPKSGLAAITCCALALALSLNACGEKSGAPDAADASAASDAETNSYRVKGIIESLPTQGPPPTDLRIHHEHIPTFVGNTGEVHVNGNGAPGMRAMTMPFPTLADDVSLDGFEVGDKIEFVFAVTWNETEGGLKVPSIVVTELSHLPPDAEISFEDKPSP